MEYRPRSRRRAQVAYGTASRIVYRVVISRGDNPRYLSVKGGRELAAGGRVGIYLERDDDFLGGLDEHNNQDKILVSRIVKDWSIPTEEGDGFPQFLTKIEERHKGAGLFYRESVPVSDKDLVALSPELPLILDSYLTDGLKKDDRMVYLSKAWLPEVAPGLVSPKEVAKYHPHGFLLTNAKTSKTTLGEKLGATPRPIERATIAHLLGFSTARRDESYEGVLNGLTGTLFVDELTDVHPGDRTMMGLMNYLEKGEVIVGRGYGNPVSGYAPIVFMGNPRVDGDMLEAAHLAEFLAKITTSYGAFGSRLGVVFVDYKATPVSGKAIPADEAAKREAIVMTLRRKAARPFTLLFREQKVLAWLEQPFEKSYKGELRKIARGTAGDTIAELIAGHEDSYRHVRGTALRLAFVDLLPSLPGQNWKLTDIDDLLSKAEAHYRRVKLMNLESLDRMALRLDSLEADPLYLFERLEALPKYLSMVVKAIILTMDKNPQYVLAKGFDLPKLEPRIRDLKATTSYKEMSPREILKRAKGKAGVLNEELKPYGLDLVPTLDRVVVINPQKAGSVPGKVAPVLGQGPP